LLSISKTDITFLHLKTKAELAAYQTKQIKSWDVENDVVSFQVFPKAERPEDLAGATELYAFHTEFADEVAMFLKECFPTKKSGSDNKKAKDTLVSEAEMAAIKKDVDKARDSLANKNMIRIHGRPSVVTRSARREKPFIHI
jgi:hypothetical protein